MARHFFKHVGALIQQAFAAQNANDDGVNVLIGLTPDLALHVLEQTEGPLPVAAICEFLEDEGEVMEAELVLEGVEATRDAATWREAG